MKRILIVALCAFILVPWIVSAQVKKEAKAKEVSTKLEAFLAKKGKLIVKNFYEVAKIAGRYGSRIEIEAVVIYEPGQESQRVRGLKVEVTESKSYGENSETSFLDLEEIESLSKALEYMSSLSAKWKDVNKEYTEVVFSTKGDFKIGFYQKGTEQGAFCSSGYIGGASCFFRSLQDLGTVKVFVDKGLKLLKQK